MCKLFDKLTKHDHLINVKSDTSLKTVIFFVLEGLKFKFSSLHYLCDIELCTTGMCPFSNMY